MSQYIWVERAEFEELRMLVYGIKSDDFDVKSSACGIIINKRNESGADNSGATVPAKVKSKSGLYYLCDIYAGGIDGAITAADQKVYVLQLNLAETLPAGTWLMVSQSSMGQTGGGNVP